MLTFSRDEIIPSTKVSRNLSSILNKLKSRELEKIGVVRNNEMEAIIIPIRDYELMQTLFERDDYKNMYSTLKAREKTPISSYINFDSVLAELNINDENL